MFTLSSNLLPISSTVIPLHVFYATFLRYCVYQGHLHYLWFLLRIILYHSFIIHSIDMSKPFAFPRTFRISRILLHSIVLIFHSKNLHSILSSSLSNSTFILLALKFRPSFSHPYFRMVGNACNLQFDDLHVTYSVEAAIQI